MIFPLFSLTSLASITAASPEIALYWGQNSAGGEQSLASYCQNSPGDIYIISFINQYGNGNPISMNIHGYYNTIPGTSLLEASSLGSEIKTCQQLGKKVLISLGGASGDYGLSSDSDAENVANELWNYFGGGSSSTRPFGEGVKVDGFDFDIENKLNAPEYGTLADKLHELYGTDSSKSYYTSAAPQCPFPDASVGPAISNAHFDYLFVQFYNNYCSLTGSSFNYDTWQDFASNKSPNKDVKIFVGLPGSSSAAGSGYTDIDQVKSDSSKFSSSPNFGGFALWDASQADSNIVNGKSYVQHLESLNGDESAPLSSSSSYATTSAAPTTSSSTWSVTTSPSQWSSSSAEISTSAYSSEPSSEPSSESSSERPSGDLSTSSSESIVSSTSTPGVVAGFTPGILPTSGPTTSKRYYSNDSTTYTTVYDYITLTTNVVLSTTPYAGGPPSVTTSPTTIVTSSPKVVDVASVASLRNQTNFNTSPTFSASSSAAPNATWVNNWDHKTVSSSEETTTIYETRTVYERTTLTLLDKPSSTNTLPIRSVNGTGY